MGIVPLFFQIWKEMQKEHHRPEEGNEKKGPQFYVVAYGVEGDKQRALHEVIKGQNYADGGRPVQQRHGHPGEDSPEKLCILREEIGKNHGLAMPRTEG